MYQATQTVTPLYMSTNDCESAKSSDFEITNKFQQVGVYSTDMSLNVWNNIFTKTCIEVVLIRKKIA